MTDPMELVGRAAEASDLRDRIVNPNVAKSEAEWWASREIERLEACIREMVEWRPIETAPRDGTVFVALSLSHLGERYDSKTFKPYSCWWGGDVEPGWARELHGWRSFGNYVAHPTHWLPLPPAPGAEA